MNVGKSSLIAAVNLVRNSFTWMKLNRKGSGRGLIKDEIFLINPKREWIHWRRKNDYNFFNV